MNVHEIVAEALILLTFSFDKHECPDREEALGRGWVAEALGRG